MSTEDDKTTIPESSLPPSLQRHLLREPIQPFSPSSSSLDVGRPVTTHPSDLGGQPSNSEVDPSPILPNTVMMQPHYPSYLPNDPRQDDQLAWQTGQQPLPPVDVATEPYNSALNPQQPFLHKGVLYTSPFTTAPRSNVPPFNSMPLPPPTLSPVTGDLPWRRNRLPGRRSACIACRKSKSKCSKETPCAQCFIRGLNCEREAENDSGPSLLRRESD